MSRHEILRYADHVAQHVELTRVPDARGLVVVVHGGFWKAGYDLSLGRPLARDLALRGWHVANVEYRRVGGGGGWPTTFDDVAAAVDVLADAGVDTSTVVALGHSAGGHLATWAAARGQHGWPERVRITHVVAQAGVLDLAAAARDRLGGDAVRGLLGDRLEELRARVDPSAQLPLDVPVWCVHGRDDDVVPLAQSQGYVAAARSAGAQATLVEVDGDHFAVIDPGSSAWARIVEILDEL